MPILALSQAPTFVHVLQGRHCNLEGLDRSTRVYAARADCADRVATREFFENLPGGKQWSELYESPGNGEPP